MPPPSKVDASQSASAEKGESKDTFPPETDEGVEETIAGVQMVGGKGAGRRALIEYVMLAGVNDTEECGRQLGELLKVLNWLVSLLW